MPSGEMSVAAVVEDLYALHPMHNLNNLILQSPLDERGS